MDINIQKRILAIAALSAIGLLIYQPPIQATKTNQPATSQASEDEPSMLVKSLSFRGIEGIATSQELEKQLPELVGTEATLRDSCFIYSYLVFKVSSKVRQERTAHLTLAGIWEIFFSAIASSSSSSSSSSVISPLIIFRNKSAKC